MAFGPLADFVGADADVTGVDASAGAAVAGVGFGAAAVGVDAAAAVYAGAVDDAGAGAVVDDAYQPEQEHGELRGGVQLHAYEQ